MKDATFSPPAKRQKVNDCVFQGNIPYEDVEFVKVPCKDPGFEEVPYELPELIPCK